MKINRSGIVLLLIVLPAILPNTALFAQGSGRSEEIRVPSYRLSDKGTFLPSIFAQYRQGYCETLKNFNTYEAHFRVGFALELKHGYNSSIH